MAVNELRFGGMEAIQLFCYNAGRLQCLQYAKRNDQICVKFTSANAAFDSILKQEVQHELLAYVCFKLQSGKTDTLIFIALFWELANYDE